VCIDQQLNDHLKVEGLWNSTHYVDSIRKLATSSFSGGERDHLFLNVKAKEFRDVGGVSGLDAPGDGRVFVHWDFDRDGWQDFAVASTNAPLLSLYHNKLGTDQAPPNVVGLRFVGGNTSATPSTEFSNRDGYGVHVLAELGERRLIREHRCGEGLAAQNSSTMLLGLAERDSIDRLTVRWPSGKTTIVTSIPTRTLVTVFEDPTTSPDGSDYQSEPYLQNVDRNMSLSAATSVVGPSLDGLADVFQLAKSSANSATPQLQVYTTMASWCQSCKKWLPQVQELHDAFDAGPVALFGVPIETQDTSEVLDKYVGKNQPAYELLGKLPEQGRISFRDYLRERLHTDALPASVVATADGQVLMTTTGVPTVSEIRRLLDSLQ